MGGPRRGVEGREGGAEGAGDAAGGRGGGARRGSDFRAPASGGGLVTMAGLDPGLTVPVWLAEDDLGCIICQGLLSWPATLPCGHNFCRDCLRSVWAAGSPGRPRSCPTCRERAAQPPQLRKNTLLQELADKYSRALRELRGPSGAAPAGEAAARAAPAPAPPRRAAPLPVGRRARAALGCARLPAAPALPPALTLPRLCALSLCALRLPGGVRTGARKPGKPAARQPGRAAALAPPRHVATSFQPFRSLSH